MRKYNFKGTDDDISSMFGGKDSNINGKKAIQDMLGYLDSLFKPGTKSMEEVQKEFRKYCAKNIDGRVDIGSIMKALNEEYETTAKKMEKSYAIVEVVYNAFMAKTAEEDQAKVSHFEIVRKALYLPIGFFLLTNITNLITGNIFSTIKKDADLVSFIKNLPVQAINADIRGEEPEFVFNELIKLTANEITSPTEAMVFSRVCRLAKTFVQ